MIRCWLRFHGWIDKGVMLTRRGHRHVYECRRCGRRTTRKHRVWV